MSNKISFLIPCYFNELNIPVTTKALIENESNFSTSTQFEYIFIDDGSKDNTLKELMAFRDKFHEKVKIIKLTGNFGAFNAISAGLKFSTGDCNIILTADLQDPIELIPKMFSYWENGIKLVIANRENRQDSYLQNIFSNFFHFIIRKFALKSVPKGGFDLILFDKKILNQIKSMNHQNTHLIYLISSLKYDYISIPYTRLKRELGRSKWTLSKKIKLFIDTFVSFSYFPLRLISVTGIFLGFFSVFYAVFILYNRLQENIVIEGWSTNMIAFLLISSFQMISIGIIGEYLWRTLESTRNRPNYIIDEVYD